MTNALIFLIDTFSRLYLLILLLRFWLPVLRANFRNSVAQGVLRYTSPLVTPVRRLVPSFGRLDTATVVIAFLIQFAVLFVIAKLSGVDVIGTLSTSRVITAFALRALIELAMLSVLLFMVAIIIRVIVGLMGRYLGPISDLLSDLTEPLLRPVRRIIPPLGVVDLSAYIVIVLLIAMNMFLSELAV